MNKRIASAIAGVAATVGLIAGAGGAAAGTDIGPYSYAKVVFCSDNRYGNEVNYYDQYGMVSETVRLDGHLSGNRWCGSPTPEYVGEYGGYTWASISNDNSPYVYCAIYDDGVLVSRGVDNGGSYGSYASC